LKNEAAITPIINPSLNVRDPPIGFSPLVALYAELDLITIKDYYPATQ
jgi:hypothetical protein